MGSRTVCSPCFQAAGQTVTDLEASFLLSYSRVETLLSVFITINLWSDAYVMLYGMRTVKVLILST